MFPSPQSVDALIEQGKKRHAALAKIRKPYTKFAGLVSGALLIGRFLKNGGDFTLPLLGLGALTLFLLYYATSLSGIKLFERRAIALTIDLFIIAVALFVSVSFYQAKVEHTGDILQIQLGEILMLALWLAFLYFVYFDWRFKGTLGKRFLALKVVSTGEADISFCQSFIRNFLSLPLPVICAVIVNHWIVPASQSASLLFAPSGHPAARQFIGDAFKNLFVSFVPITIMFFQGHQSIVDRLTRTAIRVEHEPKNLLPRIDAKVWILLCSSSLAWALLLASLSYLAVFRFEYSNPSTKLPAEGEGTWIATDPKTTAMLWIILPTGLKEPTFGIRRIELLEKSPNPFRAEQTHFHPPLNPEPYLKAIEKMPMVRVTLVGDQPLQVKLLVVENMITYIGQKTPVENRPAFTVLQLATEKKYGLFSMNAQENILLCWMTSGGHTLDFYAEVQPAYEIQSQVSLDEIGFLLLGGGILYGPGGVY